MANQDTFYLSSRPNFWRSFWNIFYRISFSPSLLAQSESRMLQSLKSHVIIRDLKIGPDTHIHTIHLESSQHSLAIPLVILPGMGAGVGFFVKNLDTFSEKSDVYSMDLLGFGRSSKPNFSSDPSEVIGQFVQSLEDWRVSVGLDKFILLGHSFGGYLATWYACQYPNRVAKLILAEPWGFPSIAEPKPQTDKSAHFTSKLFSTGLSMVIFYLKLFLPYFFFRFGSRIAKYFLSFVRADFFNLFENFVDPIFFCDYLFHYNCQYPSGEMAFSRLHIPFAWSNHPLLPDSIKRIDPSIPIHFIYGSHSWMHSTSGFSVKHLLENEVAVDVIEGGTHHVYAENSGMFNKVVCESIEKVTNQNS